MARKKWSELSRRNQTLIIIAAAVQFLLLAAALMDIRRRPAAQIRGSKRLWGALSFVDFFGPISYFAFGRKRG
jgi:hypothetical protein